MYELRQLESFVGRGGPVRGETQFALRRSFWCSTLQNTAVSVKHGRFSIQAYAEQVGLFSALEVRRNAFITPQCRRPRVRSHLLKPRALSPRQTAIYGGAAEQTAGGVLSWLLSRFDSQWCSKLERVLARCVQPPHP